MRRRKQSGPTAKTIQKPLKHCPDCHSTGQPASQWRCGDCRAILIAMPCGLPANPVGFNLKGNLSKRFENPMKTNLDELMDTFGDGEEPA